MSTLDREAAVAVPGKPANIAPARAFRWRGAALRGLATLVAVSGAAALGWYAWRVYMDTPWTRDGTVRAYVDTIAPQVAGQIVSLPVRDNQLVHKGDLLMQIDPANYSIAVRQADAGVAQAKAVAQNAEAEWNRRLKLNDIAVTVEERQTYASKSLAADASYQLALADLDNARLNLRRTRIVSPVNGYVTNLLARVGDYANVGQREISLIDADSFWVDGYFEETFLDRIRDGDPASVKLMGYPQILHGHVQSVSRGISVANAAPSASGLATVNPIFAFVRLAQRVPVRVKLDDVPGDVRLVAGLTATVEVDADGARGAVSSPPAPLASAVPPQPQSASPATPPTAGESTPLGPAEAAAEAILPQLAAKVGATGRSGDQPPGIPAPAVPRQAAPQAVAASPPSGTTTDAATAEADELLSDKTFDSTLTIEAPASLDRPPGRAPTALRRRGRGWRRHAR